MPDAVTIKPCRNPFRKRCGSFSKFGNCIRLEDQIRLLTPAERYRIRLEHAPPILEGIKKRAQELQFQLLPKSTLGQAVHYFLKEYQALRGYLDDGRFEIDNNLVENDIRPTAVGRKRWLSSVIPRPAGAVPSSTRC